jgi:hypothetical protein
MLTKIPSFSLSLVTQVRASLWALEHDVSVVITNGFAHNAIVNVVNGKKYGTFFTKAPVAGVPVEVQASRGTCSIIHHIGDSYYYCIFKVTVV